MSDLASNLDLLSFAQAAKETTANALFDAASPATMFGRRASTTAGLNWGYYGGYISVNGTLTSIANGFLVLSPSTTNYVELSTAGVVSSNTTGFTAGRMPLYRVVTGASTITDHNDYRPSGIRTVSFVSINAAGSSNITLNGLQSRCDIIRLTGTLTGNINLIVPSVVSKYIVHNSTSGAFTVTVKTAAGTGGTVAQGGVAETFCDGTNVTIVVGGVAAPTGANPTALGGLAAVNGSAETYMRSDGAPALSQSITPTWSATHTFSATTILGDATSNISGYASSASLLWMQANNQQRMRINSYSNSASEPTGITLFKSRGTAASPSDVQNGDQAAEIVFTGNSGSAIWRTGYIVSVINGTFTSGQQPPSRLDFYAGQANAALVNQMSVAHGGVGIGTTNPNPVGSYGKACLVSTTTGAASIGTQYAGADASGNTAGEWLFLASANTSAADIRVASITGETSGSTANHRGGKLRFRTRQDGGGFVDALTIDNSQGIILGNSDPGGSDRLRVFGGITVNSSILMRTKTSLTNNSGAQVATLTNAPAAGNPSVWAAIDNNGITIAFPCWILP